jgi:hypothetical protein
VPFAFAGLWERWKNRSDGTVVRSCTIITCPANELVAPLHDLMPVILAPEAHARSLDAKSDARSLLRPCPSTWLEAFPVDRRVNSPQNDDPECIQPAVVQRALALGPCGRSLNNSGALSRVPRSALWTTCPCPRKAARSVLLESETGSGKTEAAFRWASRLINARLVDGYFFAVPLRGAAVQMHGRMQSWLDASYGRGAAKALLAVRATTAWVTPT